MEDELCRHAGLYGWQPCQFRAHASSGDVERLDKGRPIFLFNANHVNKVQRTKRFGRDCITVLHNGGETLIGAPAGTANSAALERWHRFLRGRLEAQRCKRARHVAHRRATGAPLGVWRWTLRAPSRLCTPT